MEEVKRKRTKGVWIVSIFILVFTVFNIFNQIVVFGGMIELPKEQQQVIDSLNMFDYILSVVDITLNISMAIFLFLLKAMVVRLFQIALAITVLDNCRLLIWNEYFTFSFEVLIVVIISAGLCYYVMRLEREGILA
jgi:hypothetical protein